MAYPVTLNGRTYTLADFEGTNYVEGLPDAFEDFVTHAGDIYNDTSTTSNSIGTGSKTFTVSSGKPYQAGTPLRIADAAAPSTNFMDTVVTSYSGTSLVVNSIGYGGSGTKTSWTINIGGAKTIDGTLGVSQGGTGATTAAAARTNLDVYSKADADSRFLNVSGEASDVTMTGNVTIGDAGTDTLTINAATTTTADISFGNNDKAIFGSGSDLQIFSDGTKSYLIESGSGDFEIRASDFVLKNSNNTGIMASFADGGSVQLRYNNDPKLTTSSSGVDITGTLVIDDTLSIDSSTTNGFIQASNNVFQIGTSSNDRVDFYANNTAHMSLEGDGEFVVNKTGNAGGDFRVDGDTRTHLIFADAGDDAVGIGTISPGAIGGRLSIRGDAIDTNVLALTHSGLGTPFYFNTGISGVNHNVLKIKQGTDEYIRIQNGSGVFLKYQGTHGIELDTSANVIVNNSGNDQDFRVESDNISAALFVQGSDGNVGVGTSAPTAPFTVQAAVNNTATFVQRMSTTRGAGKFYGMEFRDSSNETNSNLVVAQDGSGNNSSALLVYVNKGTGGSGLKNGVQAAQFRGTSVSFNDDGNDLDFRIESDAQTHLFFVDAATNQVRIGTQSAQVFSTIAPQLEIKTGGTGAGGIGVKSDTSTSSTRPAYASWTRASGAGTTAYAFQFYDGPSQTQEGSITVTSSGTSFNTTSDYRIKENVVDLSGATERLKQLEPKRFNFIKDGETPTIDGFLAHEVSSVVPEAVTGTHNEVDENGDPVYQSIDQSKLVPLLVATIKELEARITALESN